MSLKKKNKVKKILERNYLLKNIASFIIGLFFYIAAFLTVIYLGINVIDGVIIETDTQMQKAVDVTNEFWNDRNELDKQVSKLLVENKSYMQVAFVDDNLDVIHSYSNQVPSFDINGKTKAQAAKSLKDKGLLCAHKIDVDSDFKPENIIFTRKFFELDIDRDLLEWSHKPVLGETEWIAYTTDIPNVNVCVLYTYSLNNFHTNQFSICIILITLLIIILIISLIFFPITSLRRYHYINKVIYLDPVTGGYNRDFFINNALKSIRKNRQYAVVHFRLEKYRNYCTAHGLKQGEILLEKIYKAAKDSLVRKEKISHLEKADFALLVEYTDKTLLEERLHKMFAHFNSENNHHHIVFTAGICEVQSKKDDISFILTATGIALQKAEQKNLHIVWFSDEMKEEQIWEHIVEDDMERALAAQEFKVYLQPKYATKKEELAAAEALVRWIHPEKGFISPGKFIPIFEENGFILQLDDYMLHEISKLQSQWLSEGKKLFPISVNISRAHFSIDDLAEHIRTIVDEYNVPHEYIELELTESAFFDDKSTLLSTVKKLKDYGFKISMDDFGAGYSSLNSLKELPLDIIKLDAEFFRGIDDVNRANTIVGDTIALAKKLGMEIVAEGIETREQVDFLAKQDCDLIQGFYFAKPLPVDEFIEKAYGKSE